MNVLIFIASAAIGFGVVSYAFYIFFSVEMLRRIDQKLDKIAAQTPLSHEDVQDFAAAIKKLSE